MPWLPERRGALSQLGQLGRPAERISHCAAHQSKRRCRRGPSWALGVFGGAVPRPQARARAGASALCRTSSWKDRLRLRRSHTPSTGQPPTEEGARPGNPARSWRSTPRIHRRMRTRPGFRIAAAQPSKGRMPRRTQAAHRHRTTRRDRGWPGLGMSTSCNTWAGHRRPQHRHCCWRVALRTRRAQRRAAKDRGACLKRTPSCSNVTPSWHQIRPRPSIDVETRGLLEARQGLRDQAEPRTGMISVDPQADGFAEGGRGW